MSFIASNLKYLRRSRHLTQREFADVLGIKRSSIGAYEENRAEPKYELLNKIAEFFDLTMDDLVNEKITENWTPKPKSNADNLRVLSITVDSDNNENIELVPIKASAGYLGGYGDPEYIADLPKFSLPILKEGTYRAFEIKGDSMLPVMPGDIIVAEYLEDWNYIKPGKTYIVVSDTEGIVYKRVSYKYKEEKGLRLVSDNKIYEPYWIESKYILEIWEAKAFISKQLPEPGEEPTIERLTAMMAQMQKTINSVASNNP